MALHLVVIIVTLEAEAPEALDIDLIAGTAAAAEALAAITEAADPGAALTVMPALAAPEAAALRVII